jgi:PAS domain S-box-containing protein
MQANATKVLKATRGRIQSLFRRSDLSIRLRLIACFVSIVLLMIAVRAVAVWQYWQMEAPAQRVSKTDQISHAVERVHLDVDTFRDSMAALGSSHDTRQFTGEAASIRQKFLQHVDDAEQMLRATPKFEQEAPISSALESLRVTLLSQLDTAVQLATAREWDAVQRRLATQIPALIEFSSLLVERVDQQALQQRREAIEDAQKARQRFFIIVSIAALLTLLAAAALGWYVTRAITGPLSVLTACAEALARGDFQYKVHLRGNNELAVLGNAFNYAAQQLQKLYEDLRRSERELRGVISAVPAHVWSASPDGTVDFVNERLLEFVGLTSDDILGWKWESVLHSDDRAKFVMDWCVAVKEGQSIESEVRVRRADGQYRWFLSRAVPLRDGKGEIVKWYGVSTDIEDRKRAEAEIRALKDQLYRENLVLRDEVDRASMFEEIVGASKPLRAVLSRIVKVAPTDSTVLITGETGTGKELVARAVHRRSQRCSRAFVSVNCAAIPRDLIASELFGHEKGAFTGATQRRLGRFELAEGGTIFLDEIGELPAETQIALLRVLQEHEFERVGGTGSIRADVRVIGATNRDLQAAIAGGTFRSDLFYRLNVFPIEVPPLRERKEDIPVLVEYFIDRYATKAGKRILGINKKSLELLQSYPWPGNVRELQNVIERSVIVCDTENFSVDESWLSRPPLASEATGQLELSRRLAAQERELIEAALRESGGRVSGPSGAAAKLGIPGSTLETKIKSLKIDKNRFKTASPPSSRI